MSLAINAASAVVKPDMSGAVADATPGKKIVALHLTKGFSITEIEDNGRQPGPAFNAKGSFQASGDTSGWEIGFLQITKMNAGQVFYAGRTRSEGAISVFFEKAMPAPVLLDSKGDRSPWTLTNTSRFTQAGNEIKLETGDHPALKVPRQLRNAGKNVDNFLFHAIDDREFWSVMSAMDPKGKWHHLAHFHWQVSHNVKFSWKNGDPSVASKTSQFTLHGTDKGAPKDAELQSLLANPMPPQFNEEADKALVAAFLGARGVNRVEQDTRFANVPANFWA